MAKTRIEGRLELKRKLTRAASAPRETLEAEVDWEAKDLVKRMKRIVQRRTGNLAASIREEPGPTAGSRDVKAGGPLTTKPVRLSKKGNAPHYDYALADEYGREGQDADPFFWTTVRSRRKTYRRRRATALNKAVKAAVK